jgi:hypothetical protein
MKLNLAIIGLLIPLLGLVWQGSAKLTRMEVTIEVLQKSVDGLQKGNDVQARWLEALAEDAMWWKGKR